MTDKTPGVSSKSKNRKGKPHMRCAKHFAIPVD